jgi:hypothetical protein
MTTFGSTTPVASPRMDEPDDQPDLATRQSDIAAAMDETLRRQQQLQERQDALLEQLQKIDRALDGDKPDDA